MKVKRSRRSSVRGSESKSTELVCAKVLTLMLGVVLALVVLGIAQVPATAADEQGANTPTLTPSTATSRKRWRRITFLA
jgi:hypothetical protein